MKKKKHAWWLQFTDGRTKKVFAETMTEAWKRGGTMGVPVSVSGSKPYISAHLKETTAADPEHLIQLLKYLCDPDLNDNYLEVITKMKMAAKEALVIVENFPRVVIN